MAGSGKGKHKKGKGKSKPKSDSNRQPGTSYSDPDVSQRKSGNMSEFVKPKDENPHAEINLNMDVSGWESNSEHALEMLLYNRLEAIYAEAFHILLTRNYETNKARNAILMNGHRHGHGQMSLLCCIVNNSVIFLESDVVTDEEAPQGYKSLSERVTSLMRALIKETQKGTPGCNRSDALKELVGVSDEVGSASSTHSQSEQIENCDKGKSSADDSTGDNTYCKDDHDDTSCNIKIVPEENFEPPYLSAKELEASPTYASPSRILTTSNDPDLEDSFLVRLLEKEPEDPKDLLILSAINQYRDLKQQVTESKEWALEKVMQAEQKVNNHLSELKRLRMENLENQRLKTDTQVLHKKNIMRLKEMDDALHKAMCQVEQSTAALRQLEHQNSEIREDIECYSLDASESTKTLRGVKKRERKFLKRMAAMEEEKNLLQEQVKEQKQMVLQLSQELLQHKKVQEEAEEKLAEEWKEKEVAIALVAEEERLRNISVDNLRSKQTLLRQKVETNCRLLKDDFRRLEEELANLQISSSESVEVIPPEYILHASSEEDVSGRQCVICSKKDASVLFLPCAHQVVCSKCNEEEIFGAACPRCQVQIEERVTIYGANS